MNSEKIKLIAREKYGKELTDEQAAKYAAKGGKLSDDELGCVAGGGCDSEVSACDICGSEKNGTRHPNGHVTWKCPNCGN